MDGIDITRTTGTENEWIYDFYESINSIKDNTQKVLAKEFSNDINEPIYLESYDPHSDFTYQKLISKNKLEPRF